MHIKINKTEVAIMELLAALVLVIVVAWLIHKR